MTSLLRLRGRNGNSAWFCLSSILEAKLQWLCFVLLIKALWSFAKFSFSGFTSQFMVGSERYETSTVDQNTIIKYHEVVN